MRQDGRRGPQQGWIKLVRNSTQRWIKLVRISHLPVDQADENRWIKLVGNDNQTDYSPNSNTIYFKKPPTITVTIQGQQAVQPMEGCYWTANATGGNGDYTYQWQINGAGSYPNSSQLFYSNAGSSFTVSVTVTDGTSTPGNSQLYVFVSSGNPSCQF